jgi:two-component system, OmpR family, KDP operon response regulator KdpE
VSEPRHRILIVEDDGQIRRFLRAGLAAQGYELRETESGERALAEAAISPPDLVILDLGLPDMDGVEVVRRLREWSSTPILVLSARARESDKIAALDAGADDYLTKPFGMGELLARIRVALRHRVAGSDNEASVFNCSTLRVDLAARRVTVDATEVHLTPIEYRLLAVLIQHADKVVTHRQLLKEVWGPGYVERSHYLRVHMAALRHKLEADPARPRFLLTEAGVGYRLATDPEPTS